MRTHEKIPYIVEDCGCRVCWYRRIERNKHNPGSAGAFAAERAIPPKDWKIPAAQEGDNA